MKYTLLKGNHKKEIKLINLINPILFDLYHKKIYETKKLIDNYTHKWKLYRKYKNIYEYVYTSSNIQFINNKISIGGVNLNNFDIIEGDGLYISGSKNLLTLVLPPPPGPP